MYVHQAQNNSALNRALVIPKMKRTQTEGERVSEREMVKGNQMADTSRKKGAKMEDKVQIHRNNGKNNNTKKKKKSNTSNGTDNDNKKDEPEVLVLSDSSVDSKNNDGDEEDEALQVQDTDEDEEEDEEEDAKSSGITNQRINKAKNGDEKEKNGATKKKKKKSKNGKNKKNESSSDVSHCFPMNRISRIVKSEDPDIRISQEAVFLINKASEKFLEVFCKDAYACAFLDHKNQVWYKHLSSVVSKRRRFDFLADFVPEKVKAEDTSADASIAET